MDTTKPRPGAGHLLQAPLVLLFLSTQLFAVGCQEKGPFGMSQAAFSAIIAGKNATAIVSLPSERLSTPGPTGPELYYYTARWLAELEPALASSPAPQAMTANQLNSAGSPAQEEGAAAAGSDAQAELPPVLETVGTARQGPTGAGAGPRARIKELYGLALESCTGYIQKEAGLSLVEATLDDARQAMAADGIDMDRQSARAGKGSEEALWKDVLAVTERYGDKLGPSPVVKRARLEALDALSRDAELVRECAEYQSLFAAEAADDDGFLYLEGSSAKRLDMKNWELPLKRLLLDLPTSTWTAKALDLVTTVEPEQPGISPSERQLAAMRVAVMDRDYGAAYRSAIRAKDLVFSPRLPKALVADAGKAWLYSGSSKEGLDLFQGAFGNYPSDRATVKRSDAEKASAWTASYYRARFMRALERWDDAAALFLRLAPYAPSDADGDAARWYGADSGLKSARDAYDHPTSKKKLSAAKAKARDEKFRRSELAILVDASEGLKDANQFNDLADALLREALAARDWPLIADLASKLGPNLSPMMDARASYIAGRGVELGLATGREKAEAPAFYLAAVKREGIPTYYRILAQRRLGVDPKLLPEQEAARKPDIEMSRSDKGDAPPEAERFILGFLDYGLSDLVYGETQERSAELSPDSLRRIAAALGRAGDSASSMRIILALLERPDWRAQRQDYELLYPRPYLGELRGIKPTPTVPEYILYGLLRSESFFRPDVVSSAGAVGLAQLMPATAGEIARGLGMTKFDLRVPQDNLRLGATNFGELISETGNRPLRAMFAYNAGRGRLKRWLADNEGLPDDLVLEALGIEETRQYGRNILQASCFYGELYYGMGFEDAVDGILGEKAAVSGGQ